MNSSVRELQRLKKKLSKKNLPKHIAIIMDGNGRWAKKQNLERIAGHRAGAKVLDQLLDVLLELKIPVVSMFAFSTENWRRPALEIKSLFELLNYYIADKYDTMQEKGIRLRTSGDISKLPSKSRKLIVDVAEKTSKNKNLVANFCLSYGSKDEIHFAVSKLIEARITQWPKNKQKITEKDKTKLMKKPSEKEFQKYLYTAGLPEVDFMIRTSGEQRLSNFLLYQCAYAEFYFSDVLWPDFDELEIYRSLNTFQERGRRYGGL